MYTVNQIIQKYSASKCPVHDEQHIRNVLKNSIEISKRIKNKKIDTKLLKYAVALHDFTYLYYSQSIFTYIFESFYLKKVLKKEIENLQLTEKEKKIVLNACINHHNSLFLVRFNKNKDIYSKILQDADTIDSFNKERVMRGYEKRPFLRKIAKRGIECAKRNINKFLNLEESLDYFFEISNSDYVKYKVYNPSKENVTVLLHGYADDISMWDTYVDLYRNEKIVAINFPMNMKYQENKFTVQELSDYVIEIIEELKIKRVNLIGFSLGGLVAIEVVMRIPEKIQEVTLMSSYPFLLPSERIKKIFEFIFPIISSDFIIFLVSTINTNFLIRSIAKSPKVSRRILKRMRNNRNSIFGTLFNVLLYDGRKKYKSIKIPKRIFVSLDDTVLKYEIVDKKAKQDDIPLTIIRRGGHGSTPGYYKRYHANGVNKA